MRDSFTIVLIHGHGVDASIWDGIYAGLVSDGPVLRPDFSWLTNHTTIDEYAEDLFRQLQADGIDDVMLVGHSMGGYIALAFAEQHPEMMQGLCLFHSTAYADDESKQAQRQQTIEALKTNGSAPFIEKTMSKVVSPDYPAEKVQELVVRYQNLPANALIAGMNAIAGRPDRTHVLRDARFAVLLLLGENDQVIPYEQTSRLANMNARITVVSLPMVGHLGMIEQPDDALKALNTFIARL
ncbi:alpha/beta fold hydrolase [Spirosoma arcticum]